MSQSLSDEGSFGYNPEPSLCSGCGGPLEVAFTRKGGLFSCAADYECDICSESTMSGKHYFACDACGVRRCEDCGPGVVALQDYDYVDHATSKRKIAHVDSIASHGTQTGTTSVIAEKGSGVFGWLFNSCCCETDNAEHPLAGSVVNAAKEMAKQVSKESKDVLDSNWIGVEGENSLYQLFDSDDLETIGMSITTLAVALMHAVVSEPTVVEASVPAKIFGDIHGQFRDMLLFLHDYGFPSSSGPMYIFNGDWVDRGSHQLEVVSLVFALKLAYPQKVRLLRGNHEDREQSNHMGAVGFLGQCCARLGEDLGPDVSSSCFDAFEHLPLGCLVKQDDVDKVFVCHGGIGDGQWDMDWLQCIARPLDHDTLASDKSLYNILWSDPNPEDGEGDCFGVHDSPRDNHQNLIVTFGKDVTSSWCARNNVEMIVRSHQAQVGGCGFEVMHGGRCIRVFSARDYESNGNDASILSLTQAADLLMVRPQVLRAMTKDHSDIA